MDPLLGSAILGAVPKLLEAGLGIGQTIKGSKMAKEAKRPVYQRPGEITRYTKRAQSRAADTGFSGQTTAESKIGKATADVVQKAKDVADPMAYLDVVSRAGAQEQSQLQDVAMFAAQDRERRQQEADQALLLSAQYADKEFDINKMQPYQEKAAAASALKGAGIQNISGGLSGLAGIASSMIGVVGPIFHVFHESSLMIHDIGILNLGFQTGYDAGI